MRGFIMGAVVGAGVALLYAPITGARLRALIRDKATRYSNDVEDFAEKKKRHLRNQMQGYGHKMQRAADTFSDTFSGTPAS